MKMQKTEKRHRKPSYTHTNTNHVLFVSEKGEHFLIAAYTSTLPPQKGTFVFQINNNQLLSSLVLISLEDEFFPIGPSVHTHSLRRFRRPATGVSGHESSLSDSDDDESRLSPVLGPLNLGDSSEDESAGELDCCDGDDVDGDGDSVDGAAKVGIDKCDVEGNERSDSEDTIELSVEEDVDPGCNDIDSDDSDGSTEKVDAVEDVEDSMSECAKVYFTVVISSSRGVRNDTFFAAGNMGREAVILLGRSDSTGLLESIEGRLCVSLYGIRMVAESLEEAEVEPEENVDAEFGV